MILSGKFNRWHYFSTKTSNLQFDVDVAVKYAKDPQVYLAERLDNALRGIVDDRSSFIRLIVQRSEVSSHILGGGGYRAGIGGEVRLDNTRWALADDCSSFIRRIVQKNEVSTIM